MKHLKTLNLKGTIQSIVFSPNSRILVIRFVNLYNVGLHICSLTSGKYLKTIVKHTNEIKEIFDIEISPDNRFLVARVQDGEHRYRSFCSFWIWSLPEGNYLETTYPRIWSTSFIISPNNLLCYGYSDGDIVLHNMETGLSLCLEGHTGSIRDFYISSESRFLASFSEDNTTRLWSLPDGKHITTLSGHTSSIGSLVISSDNRFLVSSSEDNTIRLYSLPDGKQIATLTGHTGYINSLVISSDNRFLASISGDGTIHIWSTSTDIAINQFTPRDITEIERKSRDSRLEESSRNCFKFTLELIHLRQQFDIDIDDSSNNIASSEYDIEIE